MKAQYDGEWITKELNDSIVLNLVDSNMKLYSSYEAVDLINVVGDDVSIRLANINDLSNLLQYGVMRFRCLTHLNEYVDIPLRNIYKLYENANIMKLSSTRMEFPNITKSLSSLDAFMVINKRQIFDKEYSFLTTIISDPSEELEKLLNISKEYGSMDMNEKFIALTKVDLYNYRKSKE